MNRRFHDTVVIILVLIIASVLFGGCRSVATPDKNSDSYNIEAQRSHELGVQQMKDGKYQEAISSFQAAIMLGQDYNEAHEYLGWAYYSVMEFDHARAEWKKALDLNPKATWAHLGIGYLHFQAGEYEMAVTSFEAAIASDPSDSEAHAALGRVYEKQGLLDRAIAELERSIELNPNVMSYWVLGEIYEQKGMEKEAQEYKEKAVSVGMARHSFESEGVQ